MTSLLEQDKEYQNLLTQIQNENEIIDLDKQLAFLLVRFYPSSDLITLRRFHFLVIWLSVELRVGHVCLDFDLHNFTKIAKRFSEELVVEIDRLLGSPTREDWIELLSIDKKELIADGSILTPLIFDDNRLYFQRLWHNEQIVAKYLCQATDQKSLSIELDHEHAILKILFPEPEDGDLQKEAVKTALSNQITIISGGPGTGKTTTVAKILAGLLLINADKLLTIGAATPTGKASARLTESLNKAVSTLDLTANENEIAVKNQLKLTALTLHKLLGAKPNSSQFKYGAENKLPFDIVLIDEASMIDVSMMAQLIEALKPTTKLILLGDKDQLASVEAGAIFNDICSIPSYSIDKPFLQNSLCFLRKSYRFNEQSGIKRWADLVNQGSSKEVIDLFKAQHSDIHWHNCFGQFTQSKNRAQFEIDYQKMIDSLASGYDRYFEKLKNVSSKEKEIIKSFDDYRILVVVNNDAFGVKKLNDEIQASLLKKNGLDPKNSDWYEGKPIMITKNNALLNLFNGDIGIAFKSENEQFHVSFLQPDGEIKKVPIALLSEYETAFAMTIHKSQGSEFVKVAIVFPDKYQPLLTRSLLYTAITRAKEEVQLYSSQVVLEQTISTKQQRQSGLAPLLLRLGC